MSDLLINEQLILIGDVDIPLNNVNTMKLLKVFGEVGYMPTVAQEINMQTGQSINRMSLTNGTDVAISFNSDRISLIRNPNPAEPAPADFVDLAVLFTQRLAQEFSVKANRCVVSTELFMEECSEEKMKATAAKFLNSKDEGDENSFEWFVRRSTSFSDKDEQLLKVSEVSRSQGKMLLNSVQTDFDRIRIRTEVGTDFYNKANRYELGQISAITTWLSELNSTFISGLVKIHHES